jgi:hypothetical protein
MKSGKVSDAVLFALLLLAGFGLLAGLLAGLVRLGWEIEGGSPVSPLAHGPFMINGFLATLIGLERAAALENKWSYIAPVSMAVSTVLLLGGYTSVGKCLLVIGSFFLFLVLVYLYRLQPETYHLIMAFGGASLWTGNTIFLLGFPVYDLAGWWIGFPLLIILGERLELNRIMRLPQKAQSLFTALVILWIVAVAFTYIDRYAGWAVASAALILLAAWLFKYDVARRTVRSVEWTRYSAVCLLCGYGWLTLAGAFGLWYGFPAAGPMYDALLHMIFVGFVFSMIFAHAAVIIPSLSGRFIRYHRYFYLPLILLHGFLMLRVIGDIVWIPRLRKSGAHGNVLAIFLFLGGIVFNLVRSSRQRTTGAGNRSG